ncbi:glycosyltransferase family 2 protein [Fodinibius sp. AD559]|uniref:glycosyltransferase family 2 protein n=1 Tax=Fodinibius sp. AD559 TaxID=3424179 RepID=UPI004046BF6B
MEYLGTEKAVNKIEPQVSVCITTYQHAPFIKKCVKSALEQQTNFPIEIIIGEDESTDGTREICKQLAEQHQDSIRLFLRSRENVRYINGNPTGRHNFLETLKAARGKYIAFCDGDDYWIDSRKLQKQYEYMESNTDISLSLHNAYVVDKKGQKKSIFPKIQDQSIINPEKIIEKGGGFCATNSVFFRSNMLTNMPDWFIDSYVGDYSLYLLAIEHGKIGALPDIMSCYRSGHTNSWSNLSNQAQHLNQYLESLKMMLFEFNEFSDHQYNYSIHIRIALEEIYTAFKIILSGKLSYLKKLSIHNKRYTLPAFKKILKRKLGL